MTFVQLAADPSVTLANYATFMFAEEERLMKDNNVEGARAMFDAFVENIDPLLVKNRSEGIVFLRRAFGLSWPHPEQLKRLSAKIPLPFHRTIFSHAVLVGVPFSDDEKETNGLLPYITKYCPLVDMMTSDLKSLRQSGRRPDVVKLADDAIQAQPEKLSWPKPY